MTGATVESGELPKNAFRMSADSIVLVSVSGRLRCDGATELCTS